jgi:hypothetical protein
MHYKVPREIAEDADESAYFCTCGEVLRRFPNGLKGRPERLTGITKTKEKKPELGVEHTPAGPFETLAKAILDGKLEEWAKQQTTVR